MFYSKVITILPYKTKDYCLCIQSLVARVSACMHSHVHLHKCMAIQTYCLMDNISHLGVINTSDGLLPLRLSLSSCLKVCCLSMLTYKAKFKDSVGDCPEFTDFFRCNENVS